MRVLFDCEVEYTESQHLSQIYKGFGDLAKKRLVDIKVTGTKPNSTIPVLKVKLHSEYFKRSVTVCYDTLDGLNWIEGRDDHENLEYFRRNYQCDYYFKRSYNSSVRDFSPPGCKTYPLGLNYQVNSELFSSLSSLRWLSDILNLGQIRQHFIKKRKRVPFDWEFEYPPLINKVPKILFLARLWDTNDVESESLQHERSQINSKRIECIDVCRREFGSSFTGGLSDNKFERANAEKYIISNELTNKYSYLKLLREHDICVATTGLHNSIGWKLSEYVTHSRAIVTEPLFYDLPGVFECDRNYLEFEDPDSLVEKITNLLCDRDKLEGIMMNNYRYYNSNLKPDVLVLNTLLAVFKDMMSE